MCLLRSAYLLFFLIRRRQIVVEAANERKRKTEKPQKSIYCAKRRYTKFTITIIAIFQIVPTAYVLCTIRATPSIGRCAMHTHTVWLIVGDDGVAIFIECIYSQPRKLYCFEHIFLFNYLRCMRINTWLQNQYHMHSLGDRIEVLQY